MAVVTSTGTAGIDGGDERGGDNGDGDFGHHLECVMARSNAGRTVRKMTRTACQKGAPDHDEATDGGGAVTALMAEHATANEEQRGRYPSSPRACSGRKRARGGVTAAESTTASGGSRRGKLTVRCAWGFRARFLQLGDEDDDDRVEGHGGAGWNGRWPRGRTTALSARFGADEHGARKEGKEARVCPRGAWGC